MYGQIIVYNPTGINVLDKGTWKRRNDGIGPRAENIICTAWYSGENSEGFTHILLDEQCREFTFEAIEDIDCISSWLVWISTKHV